MRLRLLTVAASASLLLLSGCGTDDGGTASDAESSTPSADATADPSSTATPTESPGASQSPDPSPSTAPLPACADIWTDGATLPARYEGCSEGETQVAVEQRECAFGRSLVTYDDRFYAVPGARVNATQGPLESDPDYASAFKSCAG